MDFSATNILLGITGILSLLCFNNETLRSKLVHSPYLESRNKEYYRMLTSGFIHNDYLHLLINCFVIYSFGNVVESYYKQYLGETNGLYLYVALYLVTIVASDMFSYFKHENNPSYAALGASGTASGLLYSTILFSPWSKFYLYAAIPIPAIIFGFLYLAYESYMSKRAMDNIGHDAHISGAIFGFLFTAVLVNDAFMDFFYKLMQGVS